MTPPPPKFGSRNLFNDSFLSFLRWNNNKSQLAPPVHHPDSPGGTEELQEKRYLLSEGHEFLDKTKSMLEEYSYILGKEATKRFRKMAAKLTKNAPSKAKLPKKTLGDVSGFHQNATELYQEVENILREFEQQPPHPDVVADPHHSVGRSRSSSPAPLPRKAPSPKVTFNTEMQPESKVNLTRKESTRRGVELRDESRPVGHHAVDLARQDSAKPSSSSKNRDSKEEDLTRSTSHRDGRSRKHDRDDRQEVERYRKPDDQRRSDSRRYTTDQYQSRNRDRSDPYRDREREYKQRYYDPRDHRRGYEDDYYDYDRSRHRKQDRRRDERDDIPPQNNKVSSRRNDPPMRIVHEDSPLPGPAPPADGVPFAPTYVDYPTDRREKEKRERDRERDWGGGRGDRDRDRERRDRDRPRKTDEYYYDNKPRRREYERDDEYKHRGYDKYAKPRRYEDEYRPRDRDREERDRDREPRPDKARDREPRPDRGDRDRGERDRGDRDRGDRDRGDRDRGDRDRGDRDRGDRDRGGKDRGGKDRGERERERERGDRDRGDRDRGDRERERGDRDREKDREKSHPPQTMHPHEGSPPPSPGGDPSGSKFQEVFTPDPHRSDALPQHPEADAGA